MKRLFSGFIVLVALVGLRGVAAADDGADPFPTWSKQINKPQRFK